MVKKVVLEDVLKRQKTKGEHIHKRKMFKRHQDMILEQDFAQPHSTNANQEFMENNFPAHTPTLWRYEGKNELFLDQNGMTSGPSSGIGESVRNACIGILGLPISKASYVDCEKKFGTQT